MEPSRLVLSYLNLNFLCFRLNVLQNKNSSQLGKEEKNSIKQYLCVSIEIARKNPAYGRHEPHLTTAP